MGRSGDGRGSQKSKNRWSEPLLSRFRKDLKFVSDVEKEMETLVEAVDKVGVNTSVSLRQLDLEKILVTTFQKHC